MITVDRPGYIGLALTQHDNAWIASVQLPNESWVDGPTLPTASAAITAAFFVAFPVAPPSFAVSKATS